MAFITLILFVLICSALSSAAPTLQNITISVPEGTTNHGNPSLLCFPTKAWDIIVFFLGNYVAHVATVMTKPGEPPVASFASRVYTLFIPFMGLLNGAKCIYFAACFQKSPLKIALKSGALCEVIRNQDWRPQNGEIIRDLKVPEEVEEVLSESLNGQPQCEKTRRTGEGKLERQQRQPLILRAKMKLPDGGFSMLTANDKSDPGFRQVYGICKLPKGYSLVALSPQSKVELYQGPEADVSVTNPPDTSPTSKTREECWEISCSYSIIKPLVAMIQLCYGCLTLYHARGDQVKRYGYAAFGLTVAPYVTMSFVNLCGALLTPSYSHMYLVSSTIMAEAQKRTENDFDGVVGTVGVPNNSNSDENGSFSGGFTGIFEVNNEDEVKLRLYRPNYRPQDIDHDTINGCESRYDNCQDFVVVEFPNQKKDPKKDMTGSLPILEIPSYERLEQNEHDMTNHSIIFFIMLIIGCTPIATVGGLSHFQPKNSSPFQRGWIMAWLATGVGGFLFSTQIAWLSRIWIWRYIAFRVFFHLVNFGVNFVPGLGGFIVVGKMIREYGSCSLTS